MWLSLETAAHRPHRVLVCRAEQHTIPFRETITALDEHGAPRFTSVIPKTVELVKDAARHPRQLYGYARVWAELLTDLPN
ncbi:hypothetical protein [Brachybacterium sp. Marseille-Q7125]|uniref:hypothetical protein n=1 Tax=Brachybacterium sp. Marseille-Q7125 TaxID=2932815 RepID=UPI001FF5D14E|nr:hypothetical protein [Brachybacterium sp. Marseille-Q7125]